MSADQTIAEILFRYAKGESLSSIAKHYGLTRERVRQLVMDHRKGS